ncbi:MAG: carboxypeptidase-like regulatory domain-containing protein [Flavobacteriales bacterium]|nr:carboxypeptidase-like regulatory domain-containing protein [Flavobacteriales bacterium]
MVHAQPLRLKGSVRDAATGEALVGAVVKVMDIPGGASTDLEGRFDLIVDKAPPFTLTVVFFGYSTQHVRVTTLDKELRVALVADAVLLQEAQVVRERISDRQKQAPLTVETMDLLAIKDVAGGDFYEGLGNLKGVDMTAASFGFKVINTRGFNSTSPVRSLQLIDGVDNQSPGLNFSLGNFLGASDLDVLKVDVIAGASTAFFGPGAFNGVINMTTKSPWTFPGLSMSVKGGGRNMAEVAVRWAEVLGDSTKPQRWAYKLNAYALRADDWWAENYGPTSDSPTDATNPGGFDAVNIYGDEDVSVNNNYSTFFGRRSYPGLGKFLRNGYAESDLVDYNTQNLKLGASLHHRLGDSLELVLASNFSTGSTVYQGDNRYRLKDIKFFQHRVELRQEGTWFLRAYVTHEDAGRTYDIYTTALRLQEAAGATGGANGWNFEYNKYWGDSITPLVHLPDYITATQAAGMGWTQAQWIAWQDQFVQDNHTLFEGFHEQAVNYTNNLNTAFLDPFFAPGTDRFNQEFDAITGKRFTEGGSLFFDKSALAHAMGEYKFKPAFGEVTVGGNFRQYLPNSAGTIFRDTGNVVIRNSEFGAFAGLEKRLMQERLTGTATLRLDKNRNFKALLSPALSLVYANTPAHVWRLSFSSAVRNPTLADQYLYYNVGRALLLGNVDGQFEAGRDSLFTIESFQVYRDNDLNRSLLDYFHVDRLRPEQVKTIEVGYRGTHWNNVYFDIGAYNSWYTDFIGYIVGLQAYFPQAGNTPPLGLQAYRVAANATSTVVTRGVNLGMNWYRPKLTWTFNYGYNQLTTGEDDPIIPAFNTPLNKFNAGLNARERRIPFTTLQRLGYGVNWKYVEGYLFEGSPQFTGPIPGYDMVDAQVNMQFPRQHLTVKLGASNLFGLLPLWQEGVPSGDRLERALNNDVYLVYGGPAIGRLAYVQLTYELSKR